MTPFTEKCIEVIKRIPAGKVATYGQIAKAAGNPRAARQVSRVLHSMSKKYELPWHRIIGSAGKISLKEEGFHRQKALLEAEGVYVLPSGKIDMKVYCVDTWALEMDIEVDFL